MKTMPPEEITIEPDAPLKRKHSTPCKGEQKDGTHSTALENRLRSSKKREADTNIDIREPQKIRGICVNFKYLNNPFLDK